jgi:hypothetical protein
MKDFREVRSRAETRKLSSQLIQFRKEFDVLFAGLAKPDTWIDGDTLPVDPATFRQPQTTAQTVHDIIEHIGYRRQTLHRSRRAARVHQHQTSANFRHLIRDLKIKAERRMSLR